ncbi:fatty-acyl-CoA synthase [Kitasatospora sp. GAS204A]|uniref:AMP-binding protein n=1 Tax=unclassified Kitasatospora TaxID=2633591 RepID=UPI002473B529|nr:AMP-binding protein [Kitasatospora sp. GAS204B]MDH6119740.1 fatty-acyl-CoA synthase [Kitasatospora sp. GAS204B]
MPIAAKGFRTEVQEILDVLGAAPERETLVHQGRRITAGELRDLVYRLAWALRVEGLRRGDTVTLLSGNLPQTLAVRYAASLLGCRVSHLYNNLPSAAQAEAVRDGKTRVLIVDPRCTEQAKSIAERVRLETVLTLGPAPIGADLLEMAADYPAVSVPSQAQPQDVRTISYSRGRRVQGVCHTYEQIRQFGPWMPTESQGAPRLLVCTTLAHTAGPLADSILRVGGCVVLMEGFDAVAVLDVIEREVITDLFLPPSLLYQLMGHPQAKRADTSHLRRLLYGGCPASPARIADALRQFGPVLVQLYGQREAGIISVLDTDSHDLHRSERLRSAGQALPGVEVTIRDASGRDLPAGERGEICVRSTGLMQGYWQQPELTAEVLRDGWLRTGDLGCLDSEGYLTVVGRSDVIATGAGPVLRCDVENLLTCHPRIQESAVFGVRDAHGSELVHAAVVPLADSGIDENELRAMVRERLGVSHEPTRIEFRDILPLTDAGTADRELLRLQSEELG